LTRRTFNINEPFREIMPEDTQKEFRSGLLDALGISLKSLVDENHDDKHVWVYDADDKILGVLSFIDLGTEIYADIVSDNKLFPELCGESKPGRSLYVLLEDLSASIGISTIRMDSISDRVDYWTKHHGFEMTGMPHQGKLGQVYPMEKKLKSRDFSF